MVHMRHTLWRDLRFLRLLRQTNNEEKYEITTIKTHKQDYDTT